MCDRVAILLDGRIVETGTVAEVVRTPSHPYTRMLLRAIPSRGESRARGISPEHGEGVSDRPSGCSYYSRCRERADRCTSLVDNELGLVGATHYSACGIVLSGVR